MQTLGRRQQVSDIMKKLLTPEYFASFPELVELLSNFHALPISLLIQIRPLAPFSLTTEEAVSLINKIPEVKRHFFVKENFPQLRTPFEVYLNRLNLSTPVQAKEEEVQQFVLRVTGGAVFQLRFSSKNAVQNTYEVTFMRPEDSISFWRALPYIRLNGQTLKASSAYKIFTPRQGRLHNPNQKKQRNGPQNRRPISNQKEQTFDANKPHKIKIERPNTLEKKITLTSKTQAQFNSFSAV